MQTKILNTYKNFERDRKDLVHRDSMNLWDIFCLFRIAWHERVKNHKNYDLFRNYIDPIYDVIETEFGWEEYIRRKNPVNFDTDSFWEIYQRERKPENLIGKRYKSDSFNIKAFGDMCEDAFLMNSLSGYGNSPYSKDYRMIGTKPFHLPQLDFKKIKKLNSANLHANYYVRRFSHKAEIEVQSSEFFPWGAGSYKSKIRAYDIGFLWEELLRYNTKQATISRVRMARNEAVDIYVPQLQKARKEGVYGIRPLARYLSENKIISPTGLNKWSPSMVQSILKLEKDINNDLPLTKEVIDDYTDDYALCEIYVGYVNGLEGFCRHEEGTLGIKDVLNPLKNNLFLKSEVNS